MTEEQRLVLVSTPVRMWTEDHLQQYSNSAHGVPSRRDDLWTIWPRYLDALAQDGEVDFTGVGCELLRFGDAIRAGQGPDAAGMAVYVNWARLMIAHFGWLEAKDGDNLTAPAYLLELLIAGGVPEASVRGALADLFQQPEYGGVAMAQFAQMMASDARDRKGRGRQMLFALGYATKADRQAVVDWLNSDKLMGLMAGVLGSDLSAQQDQAIQDFLDLAGSFEFDWIKDLRAR